MVSKREDVSGRLVYDIPFDKILHSDPDCFENEATCLQALNEFWKEVDGSAAPFADLTSAYEWMYNKLIEYRPFHVLINHIRI